ncbi:MAG: biopolymer transporter ExbD [Oscillatoriales cyanobacterium C42_A2020_001]|nr:biopolymer transporter ExbD [Leptolyngbyaceae cyanobacterium C42_A2020_001]
MRYLKGQKTRSQMPEVNLVPMMDVIMTILTFFIIVAMTLTGMQTVDLSLPSVQDAATEKDKPLPEPLTFELTRTRQMRLNGKATTDEEASREIVVYLQKNPNGAVLLKADKGIPYGQVLQVLTKLQNIGGDRVSLAIEPK